MAHHYGILDLKDSLMALHTRDCPNKTCFKKEHLYAGTISDNRRDVLALRPDPKRKWCRQGHEFTKSNTIWNRRGDRLCKICYEANNKRNNLKKRTK